LFFGNTISSGSKYYQINLQNVDPEGSGDVVVTADDGNDASHFITMGINGSNYSSLNYPSSLAHDGYVWIEGGNLVIASNTANTYIGSGNNAVHGINVSRSGNVELYGNANLKFRDGTVQTTAYNAVAVSANIGTLYSLIALGNVAFGNLNANAAAQDFDINSLNANIGAFQTYANLTYGPDSYADANVQAYLAAFDGNIIPSANITYDLGSSTNRWRDLWLSGNTINLGSALLSAVGNTIQLPAGSTVGGASVDVVSINANITAANLEISSIKSNLAIQANVLDVLSGNAVTQQSELANLVANAAGQAGSLTTLLSNAAAQADELNTLISNAATQSGAIDTINANIGTLYLGNISTQANIGAYQLYANANAASQQTDIDNINSNVGAYQLYANANIGTLFLGNASTNANLGAFQTYANANVGSIYNQLNTLDANVGAFELYANANIAAANVQILSLQSNIAAANVQILSLQSNIAAANIVIAEMPYTMANYQHWTSNVSNVATALDQIAARIWAIENP
jgi:hypothetical protein